VEPVHRGLFSVDVESSGSRDTHSSVVLRDVLFSALRNSFESSGIDWAACARDDLGDGMTVLVPPEFPKHRLVFPLLDQLGALLRHHNRYAGPSTVIRVRVALHEGDVRFDEFGATGRPKVLLARLLDSAPVRKALAEAADTTTVMLIVSDLFYQDVICQGHVGIDPDQYVPVLVRAKETEERAWLRATAPVESSPAESARHRPAEPEAAPRSGGVNFSSSDVRIGGDVVGGNKNVYRSDKGSIR
jgi:hypothetical protein